MSEKEEKSKKAKGSLMERLKQNSTIKETAILQDSKFFNKKDNISVNIPALNIAFSGEIDGGFAPGLTVFAGLSKSFKCLAALTKLDVYTF